MFRQIILIKRRITNKLILLQRRIGNKSKERPRTSPRTRPRTRPLDLHRHPGLHPHLDPHRHFVRLRPNTRCIRNIKRLYRRLAVVQENNIRRELFAALLSFMVAGALVVLRDGGAGPTIDVDRGRPTRRTAAPAGAVSCSQPRRPIDSSSCPGGQRNDSSHIPDPQVRASQGRQARGIHTTS